MDDPLSTSLKTIVYDDRVSAPAAASSVIDLDDVRNDMAAIFGSAPGISLGNPPRASGRAIGAVHRLVPAMRLGRLSAIAVSSVAGILLGATMVGLPHRILRADAGAMHAAASSVVASPFERDVAARRDPLPVMQLAHTRNYPNVDTKAAVAIVPEAETTAVRGPVPMKPSSANPAEAPGQVGQAVTECLGDRLERQWCLRADILAADRRLRRAYAIAIQEGVERRFLVEHQRRWKYLRDQAASDPEAVLEGYGEMAEALERLSVYGRRADRIS